MSQQTFSDIEYAQRKRRTKRGKFLEDMGKIVPWSEWVALIEPYYYDGKRGRPPMGVEKMLRMYFLQTWFTLSDEGVEDEIYSNFDFRYFMKINFFDEQVPDATTLLKFRRLLEKNELGKKLFDHLAEILSEHGYMMRGGTIVDATLISAPSSTKNASKARDPEMRSTKKGKDWTFGMKCHIGVDAGTGYVHHLESTAANVHDIVVAKELIREDDEVLYGDAGYIGIEKREEVASCEHLSKINYRINRRIGSVPNSKNAFNMDQFIETRKSSVRSKVEHPFLIVKRIFGFSKTVYRGLAKNTNRLHVLFASANLLMGARAGHDFSVDHRKVAPIFS